jgi:hypothetical protein
MGELTRVFHSVSVAEAQATVDALNEAQIPVVWSRSGTKRCLDPSLSLKDQLTLLLSSTGAPVGLTDLNRWLEPEDKAYLLRTLRKLHKERFLEFEEAAGTVTLLPPGSRYAARKAQEGKA